MEPINLRRRDLLETPHTQSEADGVFSTDMVAPLESLEVTLEPTQGGSGTPAPDNVRTISGKTQVTVTQRGKNLFDKDSVTPSSMTCYTSSGDPVTRSGIEYHLPAGTYTLKCHSETMYTYVYMNVLDANGNFISFASLSLGASAGWKKVTVTLAEGQYLIIFKGTTTTLDLNMDLQIELGTEATDYTPFVQGGVMMGGNWLNIDDLITAPGGEFNGYTFAHILDLQLKPNTSYTMSSSYTGSRNVLYFNGSSTNHVVRASTPRTQTTDETGVVKVLLFNREGIEEFMNKTVTIMLAEGTTQKPYLPYMGLGYYSSWTRNMIGGLAFANKVKEVMPAATLDTTAETITFSGTTTSTASIEIVSGIFKPNTQYTFIHTGTTGNTKNIRWIYDDDSVDAATRPSASAYVSTAGKTVKALEKINNNSAPVTFQYMNCGVFEGVWSADDFEPYVTGEVYGGTVDIVNGTLTVDRKIKVVNAIEYVLGSPKYIKSDAIDGYVNVSEIYPSKSPASYQPEELVADRLKFQNKGIWATVGFPNCWTVNGIQIHINVANDLLGITDYTQETTATAKEKLNTWLASNPVTVTIPVRPTVYQLSPTQVMSLLKDNVFLSEDGSITYATHWRHTITLPSAYQRIQYLESTGTQYINTGKRPTDNTRMQLKYYTTSTGSFYCAGARNGSSTIYFAQSGATSGAKVSCTVNGTSVTAKDSGGVDFKRVNSGQLFEIMVQTNSDSTYDYSIVDYTHDKYFRRTGVSYTPMGTVSTPIYLFALNTSYAVSGTNRCYYFKLYRDGRIILDGVPCYRKSDGVAGLYDLVTGTFFTNSGSGEFVKGPDI